MVIVFRVLLVLFLFFMLGDVYHFWALGRGPSMFGWGNINEVMQDYVETQYGIVKFWQSTKNAAPKTSRSGEQGSQTSSVDGQHWGEVIYPHPRGPSVHFGPPIKEPRPISYAGRIAGTYWNEQISFNCNRTFAVLAFDVHCFNRLVRWGVALEVFLLLLYCLGRYGIGGDAFSFGRAWGLVVAGVILIFIVYFHASNQSFEDDYGEEFQVMKNHQGEMNTILSAGGGTRILPLAFLQPDRSGLGNENLIGRMAYPSGPKINHLHRGKAFLGDTDVFTHRFLRVNVNVYTYLFYGISLADLRTLNPMMNYQELGDGIVLGKYRFFIDSSKRFFWNWLASLLFWSAFLLMNGTGWYQEWRKKVKNR